MMGLRVRHIGTTRPKTAGAGRCCSEPAEEAGETVLWWPLHPCARPSFDLFFILNCHLLIFFFKFN
jgi:hypothetical protein